MNIKGAPYHHTLEVLNNFSSPSFSFAHFSQLATIERERERERERVTYYLLREGKGGRKGINSLIVV